VKVTIIYDNTAWDKNLKSDWGFSCLVEVFGKNILFDTGAKADILDYNMKQLKIDPLQIDEVFISHSHWDHTGGLHGFNEFHLIDNLETVCPTHCTRFIQDIKKRYPDKTIDGGAGKVITT
jgi:metal-dependent hydrolase (beta-lactamase superfamily II)